MVGWRDGGCLERGMLGAVDGGVDDREDGGGRSEDRDDGVAATAARGSIVTNARL